MRALRSGRAGLVAVAGAATMVPLWWLPGKGAIAVSALLHMTAMLLAGALLVRAARRGDAVMRRPRLLLAAALGATGLGALTAVGYTAVVGFVPVPSLVDLATFVWVPCVLAAFWLVPVRDETAMATPRIFADAAVAASALLFVAWVTVIEPVAASGRWSLAGEVVEVAYPVLDVFVVAVVLSMLGRVRTDLRPFMDCVALGLLLVALSDARSVQLLATRGFVPFGWQDLTLQAALVLFAYASVVRRPPVLTDSGVTAASDRLLPVVPVLLAVAAGLWRVTLDGELHRDDVVMAAVMVVSLVLRQVLHTRELVVVAEQHRKAATEDALTGLASRKLFISRLTEHLGTPGTGAAAVILADLNGFKEINDTLGHETGDRALRTFAGVLATSAGRHLCARLGGDEFAVLVVAADPERESVALADRVQGRRVPVGARLGMSCSIGIAVIEAGDGPADILRRADLAMYSAKRSPGSRVAVFDHSMGVEIERRNLLTAELEQAAARGELSVAYQPVVRLSDGTVTGAEALLRWAHPLFGDVPPSEFVPLAEEAGRIGALGHWVLDTALAQVATWQAAGRYLPRLYVNMAASQFTDSLADEVVSMLDRHGVSPDRLTLEITESQLPGLAVNASLQRLRRSGVQVALDDFGAGYFSLAHVSRLPVDVLKIDREFMRDLDARSGPVVLDAVVNLARALGVATVAEGIEDLAQAEAAVDAGVDLAQGYLFSRPVSAPTLGNLLPPAPAFPVLPSPREGSAEAPVSS